MLAGFRFCGIGKGGEDGFAFVPIRELVGVVAAADLAGLASRDELDGGVPVGKIGDESHGRAVMRGCRARAVAGAGLRHV